MRVSDIDPPEIIGWLNSQQRKDGRPGVLSNGTKRLNLEVLAVVLDYAVEKGSISSNPARRLSRKAKPNQESLPERILSPEEHDRLLASCENFPWLRPIIETALLGALRLGEILALRWRDVDFEAGKLHVRRSYGKDGSYGPPKGGKEATIDLHPRLREVLADLATLEAGADDLIFRNTLGTVRNHRDVQRAFGKARRYATVSEEPRALRFDDLRHTAISRLANAPGANMPWVQGFARHSNLATTLGYVHEIRDEERVAAAFAALSAETG